MLDEKETFVALFKQLTKRVRSRPTNLVWLSREKGDVRRLASLIEDLAGKLERESVENPGKSTSVPSGYISAWNEYKKYRNEAKVIANEEKKESVEKIIEELKEKAEGQNRDLDDIVDELFSEFESKKEPGDSFNPLEDDPVSLIMEMLSTYEDMVADGYGYWSSEEADKPIGAWRFFERTIGVDHNNIYARWKRVPELFIPKHAGSVNLRPVEELYNEAVRTFVFGSNVASIAMCRALLEHVLKKHYKMDAKDLDKMIYLVEKKYYRLKKLNLDQKRKTANLLMHNFEKQGEIEDQLVVDFLNAIKELVKNIPKKSITSQ